MSQDAALCRLCRRCYRRRLRREAERAVLESQCPPTPATSATPGGRRGGCGEHTKPVERVEILEHKVGALEELPVRVDGLAVEIAQLRTEMRGEFSAIRAEMKAGDEETRAELEGCEKRLIAEMTRLNQETRTHMLVLHEDLVERMKWIREGTPPAPAKETKTTGAQRGMKKPRK